MNRFDNAAADWDKNKVHQDRTEAIAKKLEPRLNESMKKAMEYGAGTGLLSFRLSNLFTEIVMMDSSVEMVNTAAAKAKASEKNHLKAVWIDLEHQNYTGKEFDVVFTQMVLHHVKNIGVIFEKFYHLLSPNGLLAIADLYPEDGSFHGDDFDGHPGFDPEMLKDQLQKLGFENISYEECFVISKETKSDLQKDFPVFLLTAYKA